MCSEFVSCVCCRTWLKAVLSVLFVLLMTLLCVSRCFIAAHFPHQVIVGAIIGMQLLKIAVNN